MFKKVPMLYYWRNSCTTSQWTLHDEDSNLLFESKLKINIIQNLFYISITCSSLYYINFQKVPMLNLTKLLHSIAMDQMSGLYTVNKKAKLRTYVGLATNFMHEQQIKLETKLEYSKQIIETSFVILDSIDWSFVGVKVENIHYLNSILYLDHVVFHIA